MSPQTASVAEYQRLARDAIGWDPAPRGRVPVLAGGSGLYVRAALDPLEFPGTDPGCATGWKRELAEAGPALHARLAAARPGGGRRDPAVQRAPDSARTRGDRGVRPPVQRDAAAV